MKRIIALLLLASTSLTNAQVIIGDNIGTATDKTSVLLEFAAGQNKGLIVPYVRTLPGNAVGGTIVLDASTATQARMRFFDGTNWIDLSGQNADITAALVNQPSGVTESATSTVIIGAETSSADGALVLESTIKAMVLPIVANVQDIASPSPGMMVYVSDIGVKKFAVYNGSKWSFWEPTPPNAVLAQIGQEGDSPNTVPSVVTTAQLESIPGVNDVVAGNQGFYRDYIDANPDSFSEPATVAEVNAMIATVNEAALTSNGSALVSNYTCSTASAGTMVAGTVVSGVTQTITATVDAVGSYNLSMTTNGVTFAAAGIFTATGNQDIVLTATGTPTSASPKITFTINTTPNCNFTRLVTIYCTGAATTVVDVTNATTGKTWMDRNLGASRAATSLTDTSSYGDLYQWGRLTDGHQCRTPLTTTGTASATDQPNSKSFITTTAANFGDWRTGQNVNLWQGVNGINNPCPTGYRLPTRPEFEAEKATWTANTNAGAYASILKLSLNGVRTRAAGAFGNVGTTGYYWTSTVTGTLAENLNITTWVGTSRANGAAVRCIKN